MRGMELLGSSKCLDLLKKQHLELQGLLAQGIVKEGRPNSDFLAWMNVTFSIIEKCYPSDDRRYKLFLNTNWEQFSDIEIESMLDGSLKGLIQEIERDLISSDEISHLDNVIASEFSEKIIIVHGHADALAEEVYNFVDSLNYHPSILLLEPDRGDTIIEKLERISKDVGFAIILLTGDDMGGKVKMSENEPIQTIISRLRDFISKGVKLGFAESEEDKIITTLKRAAGILSVLKPRARQNVIFEFGYFIGFLGRSRICALYEKGVEMPTDVEGFIYKPLDTEGKWKDELKKELDDWKALKHMRKER